MQSRVPPGVEGHRSDNAYPQPKLNVSLDDVSIEGRHGNVEYKSCFRKCLIDAFSSSETFVIGNDWGLGNRFQCERMYRFQRMPGGHDDGMMPGVIRKRSQLFHFLQRFGGNAYVRLAIKQHRYDFAGARLMQNEMNLWKRLLELSHHGRQCIPRLGMGGGNGEASIGRAHV